MALTHRAPRALPRASRRCGSRKENAIVQQRHPYYTGDRRPNRSAPIARCLTSIRSTSSILRDSRATAIRTRCGHGCAPRRPSRTSRRRGTEPFWAITKHADIVRDRVAAAALLERARDHRCELRRPSRCRRRWSSCSIRRGTVRCAGSRAGASRRARCTRSARTSSASRSRSSTARRPRAPSGEMRLRRAHRCAAPDRGDRLDPRRAARRLGAAVPLDQRGDRQGRSGVPAPRRDARPDHHARARRAARLLRAPDRRSAGATRRTIW